jgi:tRNA(His) 5'-end guanylyltransferase
MAAKPRRDALGDRMKRYEAVTRYTLPRRTYTLLRVDGRAFHSWTKGLDKPYDTEFMSYMDITALALCKSIPGAQFAYVQSDEISVLAVDFLDINTEPWFDGGVQKWASVAASIATVEFNVMVASGYFSRMYRLEDGIDDGSEYTPITKKAPDAVFDARVYTIPDLIEVENYFVWRQQDAERNSVMMLARAYASHKQLAGKNRAAQHEIIHKAGDNWAKHPVSFKHGRVIRKIVKLGGDDAGVRSNWKIDHNTPVFTKDREYLRGLIPVIWNDDLLVRKAASNG